MNKLIVYCGITLLGVFTSIQVLARPEYAAKLSIVNCQTCHYSPSGAGPRNENGTYYGWRSKQAIWDKERKFFHLDMRMNVLYPQRPDQNNNGLALMGATAGVTIPVTPKEGAVPTVLVMTYDMGTLGANAPRDAYVQFPNETYGTFTVGRFLAPFGLITDEHRAYTRLQTKTTINNFEMGVMYSKDLSHLLHVDAAITSGFAQGGAFSGGTTAAPEQTSAGFVNVRFKPWIFPGFVGLSYSNSQSLIVKDVQAASIYGALAPMSMPFYLLTELVWAQGWNNQKYNAINMGQFVPGSDIALQQALEKSSSLGGGAELGWELNPWWTLQYRYDRLVLDKKFDADAFQRHGVGFKHFVTATTNVLVRYEKAVSTVNEVPMETVRANKDSFYLILNSWL